MTLLTTTQLAERWQMDAKSVANLRTKGTGPKYIKLGSERTAPVRYRLEDIVDYEAKHLKEHKQ